MVPRRPTIQNLHSAASVFVETASNQIKGRELLRRVDTKFVIPAATMADVLSDFTDAYTALPVHGGAVATYRNLYFDTPDLQCFHDHRRGRRIRHRIRIRHYPERELSYIEIKTKRNESVTLKERKKLPYGQETLSERELNFLATKCALDVSTLRPTLRVDFSRLSLVGIESEERATFDFDLRLARADGTGARELWSAIVEVKQPQFTVGTPVMRALRARHLREQSLSKYSTGIALLYPVSAGRLRPDLRRLESLERARAERG